MADIYLESSSECTALAPRSIQTAKVISHTEAFNYVWLNDSCLASRMTSRLNNRTIRALSGADGNTTWYLLNAPPSMGAHSHRTHSGIKTECVSMCVFALVSSIHLKLVCMCSIYICYNCTPVWKYRTAYFIDTSHIKISSLGTAECNGRWVACLSDKQWVRQGNVSPRKNRQHLKPKSLKSSANGGRDIERERWSTGEKDREGERDGVLKRESLWQYISSFRVPTKCSGWIRYRCDTVPGSCGCV